MSYNYTVIIPHKNIHKLLERCLASIPARDDVQVIVVDDNSNPAIVDFEKFPGLERADVEVIFAKNGDGRSGAGCARNRALDIAGGKWVTFVDADDFFHTSIGEMMDKYRDSEADIVYLGNSYVDCDTLESVGTTRQAGHIDAYLSRGDERGLRRRMNAPWGKFVKRNLIEDHGIRFSETPSSNDMLFSVKSGHYAKGLECDPVPVYCYTKRSGAISSPGSIKKRLKHHLVKSGEDMKVAGFRMGTLFSKK